MFNILNNENKQIFIYLITLSFYCYTQDDYYKILQEKFFENYNYYIKKFQDKETELLNKNGNITENLNDSNILGSLFNDENEFPTEYKYYKRNNNNLLNTILFIDHDKQTIKNTVKSPYVSPTGSYKPQTFISKIGIFDKDKNLIAIAKVANPVKKTEDRELTFKLKLDF